MSSFLDRLDSDMSARVRAAAYERALESGEVLVRQGELGRALYLVMGGGLEARTGSEVVNQCEPGDVVGEMAFLDGEPRSADLVAREASVVLVWTHEAMTRMIRQDPAIQLALLRSIAKRQARSVRRMTEATSPSAEVGAVRLGLGTFRAGDRFVTTPEGEQIKLSPNESRLLSYLVVRPGRTITQATLLEEVWGYKSKVSSRTVYATVHRLRVKVEVDPADPQFIVSVPGEGYRFEPHAG